MRPSVPVFSAPIHRLKRQAKVLARERHIPLHAALDRVAQREGYAGWSLLASRWAAARSEPGSETRLTKKPAVQVFERLCPGDVVLLGARRGQGKTRVGVELIVEAARRGGRGRFFTLEETVDDFVAHLRAVEAAEPFTRSPGSDRGSTESCEGIGVFVGDTSSPAMTGRILFDDSNEMSAPYVIERLAHEPAGTIAVIDYLQIMDQRRDKPDLSTQIAALRAFAKARGVIIVCLSQIDRRYDAGTKPLPDRDDVRLPNPLDLALFDKACFMHAGRLRLS